MTREEIMELLDVNKDRMKYLIKHNKLREALQLAGYDIVKQYKMGRNSVYDLEQIEIDKWEQYQHLHRIRKKEEHTIYVENRLSPKGLASSRRSFVNKLDIDLSETTAKKYDDILLDDEMMAKDRIVYLLFNPNTEAFKEITELEYKQFWSDVSECKIQLAINRSRYTRGEIPERAYDTNKLIFMNALGKEKGEIALKFDTYKEYTNTLNALDIIKKHRERKAT